MGSKCYTFAMIGALMALAAVLVLAVAAPNDLGGWTMGPPLSTARSEVAVAAIGSRLYVVGGFARGGDQRLVEEFDVAAGRWRARASLPHGMNHLGLASFAGKLYAFGGFSAETGAPSSDAVVYDPATDRWRALAPVPTARGSISVAVLNDAIHLVGGHDRRSVSTHDVYDPVTNAYTHAAPLPVGRDHMGLAAYGGKLYAIAGRIDDYSHNTSSCDVYDPATDRWTACQPMPSRRSGMGVAVYRDRIQAIGGEERAGVFANDEAYDPRTNAWTTLAPLPEGRHGMGAATIGDRLYVPAGGPAPGGSQSTTLFVYELPAPSQRITDSGVTTPTAIPCEFVNATACASLFAKCLIASSADVVAATSSRSSTCVMSPVT
ncbi:MAG: Kelch repeat-containing protein precursor [Candidatus Eremiobacteraeota bacterium]|nr:Kelch repeat-containing protein precursor [Candidatus Eremiobacteraeota bacterium]